MPPPNGSILKTWVASRPMGEQAGFCNEQQERKSIKELVTCAARSQKSTPIVFSDFFSARLKAARKSRGLSQRQLGALSSVQYSAIAHFESGRRLPTLATLCLLSQALGVTTDYLLGTGEMPSSARKEDNVPVAPAPERNSAPGHNEEECLEWPDKSFAPRKVRAGKTLSTHLNRNLGVSEPNQPSTSLTYRIIEDLGAAIVTERYPDPGKVFPMRDLCEHYGTGMAILREAVATLKSKGLLDSLPKRGTWVQPFHMWNLFDQDVLRWSLKRPDCTGLLVELTQLRLAVEPFAAGLAARLAEPAQRTTVLAAMEQLEFARHDDDRLLSSDIEFHFAVMQASGNRFCAQHCCLVETALRHSFRLMARSRGDRVLNIEHHQQVADAILASNVSRAEIAMRKLIDRTLALICSVQGNSLSPVNLWRDVTASETVSA